MTDDGIANVLALFESAYRMQKEATARDAQVWGMLLRDVADGEGLRAAAELCGESKFPPSVYAMLAQVYKNRGGRTGVPTVEQTDAMIAERYLTDEEAAANRKRLAELMRDATVMIKLPAPR